MRTLLNISAVLACAAIAGLCSLVEGTPSHAASVSASALIAGGGPARIADAALVEVRRSGGVEAHFAAANTSHDGHLTRDEALRADWTRVARHFDEIDTDHRGWVTVEQIHQFNRAHARHRKAQQA